MSFLYKIFNNNQEILTIEEKELLYGSDSEYDSGYENGEEIEEIDEDEIIGDIVYGGSVINLAAQYNYGRGKRHLNYGALAECIDEVKLDLQASAFKNDTTYNIGVPYKMGSDRAGGDWGIVKEIIEHYLEDVVDIVYYKL